MDKMLNSKKEKDSIYEIYRACRLCGGGAGYKMPIIQSIVDVDGADVELKQKIRECVQIEVTQDDKMPPLICELCVDKVNDFYEFLEMCRQTNKRTRLRLGLPPQALARGAADAGDCILGLTEPVFVNDDSDANTTPKIKKTSVKGKAKKEPVVKLKVEKLQEKRFSLQKRDPTPPRTTRNRSREEDIPLKNLKKEDTDDEREKTPPRITRNRSKDEDIPLYSLKDTPRPLKAAPKSILKKESSFKIKEYTENERSSRQRNRESTPPRITRNRSKDDDIPLNSLKNDNSKISKRPLEKETKVEPPPKKVKITIKPITAPARRTSPKPSSMAPSKLALKTTPGPKSKTRPTRSSDPAPRVKKPSTPAVKRDPSPVMEYNCDICGQSNKTTQARISHWKTHTVGFTNPKLACNPCGEWFVSQAETTLHHEMHKTVPYSCENCYSDFKSLIAFDEHLKNDECIPMYVAPDVKCDVCWHMFPTYTALYSHECAGEEYRPGGNCAKCDRSYVLLKNLVKHESTCTARKKGELIVDKKVMDSLKPIQIRLERCDALQRKMNRHKSKHTDDDSTDGRYHPYRLQLHKAGFRGMVKIHDEIKKAFCSQEYVHWDSAESEGSDDEILPKPKQNSVHSLVALTLKTIFSQRLVGKVPRKKRRVKIERVFDSLQNDDIQIDISNIIDKLCEDENDDNINKSDDISRDNSNKSDDKNIAAVNDVQNDSNQDNIINNDTKNTTVNVKNIINDSNNAKNNDSNSEIVNDNVNDKLLNNSNFLTKNHLDSNPHNNDISHTDESQLACNDNEANDVNKSKVNDIFMNNDNIKSNDKKQSIDDILSKSVEIKSSLGINDFSFDTI